MPFSVAAAREFGTLSRDDIALAGGKGANLGELTRAGLPVPAGFVVGSDVYAAFCDALELPDQIAALLEGIGADDDEGQRRACASVQALFFAGPLPEQIAGAIASAYAKLSGADGDAAVAVRSSATAEDTAAASFAGMNESYLNVRGVAAVEDAVRRCWASLFSPRSVSYRAQRGISGEGLDIAVVIQEQIEATRAGVMFTIDPATGDTQRLIIEGAFGLGESVVSGQVSPDRYIVTKDPVHIEAREVHDQGVVIVQQDGGGIRSRELDAAERGRSVLADDEILALAELGRRIEAHYAAPQDTEWAIDAGGKIWIVQSRPITAVGHRPAPSGMTPSAEQREILVRGLGAAPGCASGPVCVVNTSEDAARLRDGDVLVAPMTAPDWVPLMRRAAAVVTDSGGMTCHAAIVSRELGVPCLVGTRTATQALTDGQEVTVDTSVGVVIAGLQPSPAGPPAVPVEGTPDTEAPPTTTQILVNLSEPSQVESAAALAVDGVGLLRAELMLLEALDGQHPRLLIEHGRSEELVTHMAGALSTFAEAFSPRPITYRTIDFRTNEFRRLEGGQRFEPEEANPMIGYRGALRYLHEPDLFGLELQAVARVWDAGHENLHVMIPFLRTPGELTVIRELVRASGLAGRPGFELWVMAEVPSVLFHLERYRDLGIAGVSIGSNDLTQLLLGADRDSALVAEVFDERDAAVTEYIARLIKRAQALGLKTSICGQAPSVYPEYADLLVAAGIDAISVSPDAVNRTRRAVAASEARLAPR